MLPTQSGLHFCISRQVDTLLLHWCTWVHKMVGYLGWYLNIPLYKTLNRAKTFSGSGSVCAIGRRRYQPILVWDVRVSCQGGDHRHVHSDNSTHMWPQPLWFYHSQSLSLILCHTLSHSLFLSNAKVGDDRHRYLFMVWMISNLYSLPNNSKNSKLKWRQPQSDLLLHSKVTYQMCFTRHLIYLKC